MPSRILVAILLGLCAAAQDASADILRSAGDLVCAPERNIAVARFAQRYNDDLPVYAVLPPEIDGGLSADKGTDRRVCTLSNSWQVRLRIGSRQAFAYGMGGASPSQFFSLWIDRRKLISHKTWLPGYQDNFLGPRIVAIVVTPSSLWTCAGGGEDGEDGSKTKVECRNEPLDLAPAEIDRIEYPPPGSSQPMAGSMVIAIGADKPLCRALVKSGPWQELKFGERTVWDFNFSTDLQPDIAEHSWVDISMMTPIDATAWPSVQFGTTLGSLDLDGDGRREAILYEWGSSHAYDGSSWIVIAPNARPAAVIAKLFPDPADRNPKVPEGEGSEWFVYEGGHQGLYPGVSSRYVHLDGYTYKGRVYFLAHPTNVEHDPTAMLIRPLSRGRFETVCQFQIVRPNF